MQPSNRFVEVRLALLVILLMGSLPALSAQEIVLLDEIVARVNHEVITMINLNKELRILRASLVQETQNPERLEQQFQREKRALLRTMIQTKMLVQRAEEFGISSNIEGDVTNVIEEMRKGAGIPNLEILDQYLQQQGSSLEDYRDSLRQRLTIDSLLQQFVYSKLTLLTPEIEAYYQEHIEEYTEKAQVELQEILFLTEGEDKAQLRVKAEEVLAQLRAGASFEESAKQYSDGPTAARGGEIGSFKQGSMSPLIEEVAFQLKEGDISGIIETEYGLQIIKVVSHTAVRLKPVEEVRPEISRQLYEQKAQPGLRKFMDELREQSYIFISQNYREEYDLEGL
ncbi:MAG: peptidylprolyl isomerase [Acidobacteria bacterium]|nr:peptidylprolyl isomerase [Acidobacteriota bacterium]